MSNFFEQELWYLFGDEQVIDTPYCSGQSCYRTLDRDLRVRIQFISTHISGQYDALKLTVLNRINGPVDIQVPVSYTHLDVYKRQDRGLLPSDPCGHRHGDGLSGNKWYGR